MAITTFDTTLDQALIKYPGVAKLNLVDGGDHKGISSMQSIITKKTHRHKRIRVRILLDEGEPVAWGWIIPEQYKERRYFSFFLFVQPSYRRAGLGKSLYQWAREFTQRQRKALFVYPWNVPSAVFYNQFKVPDRNRRSWY